ncbi:MAG: protein kinase family protein [Chlamydiota bacterium]|nr:protein kinase family protein [Chlamydiota bacterium]
MSTIYRWIYCFLGASLLNGNLLATESLELQTFDRASDRKSRFYDLSNYLQTLNNAEMLDLLSQGELLHSGNGTSLKLEVNGIPVFVKKIPLNSLEGNVENFNSTANVFNLPPFYQYGVGSAGFNVWREVSAHRMTTEWVLANKTQNFPLVYHWRTLDNTDKKEPLNEEEWKKYVAYWDGSEEVGERVRANHNAPTSIAIFIEYFPMTVKRWLATQLDEGPKAIDRAVAIVEKKLLETTFFMNTRGMLHFDAHFDNILTDGEQIYFTDFGLSTSLQFSLSNEELQFFKHHQNYDRCYVITVLTQWIISKFFGKDQSEEILREYACGKIPQCVPETLTPYLSSVVQRYAPLSLRMGTFFKMLRKKSKQTPYPAEELEQYWNWTQTEFKCYY